MKRGWMYCMHLLVLLVCTCSCGHPRNAIIKWAVVDTDGIVDDRANTSLTHGWNTQIRQSNKKPNPGPTCMTESISALCNRAPDLSTTLRLSNRRPHPPGPFFRRLDTHRRGGPRPIRRVSMPTIGCGGNDAKGANSVSHCFSHSGCFLAAV